MKKSADQVRLFAGLHKRADGNSAVHQRQEENPIDGAANHFFGQFLKEH